MLIQDMYSNKFAAKLMNIRRLCKENVRNLSIFMVLSTHYPTFRLPKDENDKLDGIIKEILSFTNLHPYYTQQLSAQVWEMMTYDHLYDGVVSEAISKIVRTHDLDFERLWLNFNRTDRSIMISLSKGVNPMQNRQMATSTSFSAIKRLMKSGYIIKVNDYEIEDPFFREWILRFCI